MNEVAIASKSGVRILTKADRRTRIVCEPVTVFDASVEALAIDLFSALKSSKRPGVGLSANQIGDRRRVFVIDLSAMAKGPGLSGCEPLLFINPEIRKMRGMQRRIEGCLSCDPEDDRMMDRARIINWTAQALDGRPLSGKCADFLAQLFQHEMDHLNGILIVDKPVEGVAGR